MKPEHRVPILIVDDDEGHAELVRRNLRRAGVSNAIESLTSGAEALDYVFCRGAHAGRTGDGELLILLDINMPGDVNGVEVLRQIKAEPSTRKVPVIMLTTTDDPREINRCYELGCSAYITKPVDPPAFMDAIGRLGAMISVMKMPMDPSRLA